MLIMKKTENEVHSFAILPTTYTYIGCYKVYVEFSCKRKFRNSAKTTLLFAELPYTGIGINGFCDYLRSKKDKYLTPQEIVSEIKSLTNK